MEIEMLFDKIVAAAFDKPFYHIAAKHLRNRANL